MTDFHERSRTREENRSDSDPMVSIGSKPQKEQYDALDGVLRDPRRLHNAALEEPISRYRDTGASPTLYDQMKSPTLIRREHEEYGNLPVSIGRHPLMALDRAFKAFSSA